MGVVVDEIDDAMRDWLCAQPMFFVGTAPSGDDGHVNVSPKGDMRTFAVLGPRQVAYVDLFGSGIETVAHLKQNGRIVVMACAFTGRPQVVRLHGRGRVVEMQEPGFEPLVDRFDLPQEVLAAARSIVTIDVQRVSTSCGFVVPMLEYGKERDQLLTTAAAWRRKRGPSAIRDYCDVNNGASIDDIEGLTPFGDGVSEEQQRVHSAEGRKL